MQWEALERGKLTIHVRWTGEERPDTGATFLDLSRLGLKEEAKRIPRQITRRTNGVETSLTEEQEQGEEPENFTVFPMEDSGIFLRKVIKPALLEQLHAGCASVTARHLRRQYFFTWMQDRQEDGSLAQEEDYDQATYASDLYTFRTGTQASLELIPEEILIPSLLSLT